MYTVAEAVASRPRGAIHVRGYVVSPANRPIRFCTSLAESDPPQCGHPSLLIQDVDLENVAGLQTAEDGTAWTTRTIELVGVLRGESLVIEEAHQ